MLRFHELLWLLALGAAPACEIAANIDRRLIPGEGGGTAASGGAAGGGGAAACEPASCPGTDTDCRKRACDAAGCGFADEPSGTACADPDHADAKLCDGSGNCVACLASTDCPSTAPVCLDNLCHLPTCGDGLENGGETDIDCGGECPGCANGMGCAVAADCASGFCEGAGGSGAGTCTACVNPADCEAPLSCVNGVCR